MRDAIYTGKNKQTPKKRMGCHLYDLLHLLKNRKQSYSFSAHSEQHIKFPTSFTDLRKCIAFKLVKQINPIGVMKTSTKSN